MKRALIWLVVVVSCGSGSIYPATAQESIPERIGDLPYKGAKRFEDPRLGMVLVYEREQSEMLSIYVYDLGLESIPRDLQSEVVVSQFRQAQGDVSAADTWQEVTLQSEGTKVLGADGAEVRAHEAVYVLMLQERRMASYLYLLSTGRAFLKVRYTAPLEAESPAPPLPEQLDLEIGKLLKSWIESE